jgi:hypothetical protein
MDEMIALLHASDRAVPASFLNIADHVLSLPFNYPSPTADRPAHSLCYQFHFLFYCREMRDDSQVIFEREILFTAESDFNLSFCAVNRDFICFFSV